MQRKRISEEYVIKILEKRNTWTEVDRTRDVRKASRLYVNLKREHWVRVYREIVEKTTTILKGPRNFGGKNESKN